MKAAKVERCAASRLARRDGGGGEGKLGEYKTFLVQIMCRCPLQISAVRVEHAVALAIGSSASWIRWHGAAALCAKRADASLRVEVASCFLLADCRPVSGMSSAAPTLYRDLHKKFIHNLDRAKDSYEFAVTDQLRMSGKFFDIL